MREDVRDARIAELEAALAARDTLIETLRFQLAQLRRMTFGQSSEKLSLQIEQLELTLEELEGEAEVADARKTDAVVSAERSSPARALPEHLPRIEPAAGSCACPACVSSPTGGEVICRPALPQARPCLARRG